jgi:hypothetical protein
MSVNTFSNYSSGFTTLGSTTDINIPVSGLLKNTFTLNSTPYTIPLGTSGCVYSISVSGTNLVYTLPAIANSVGAFYTFILSYNAGTNTATIKSPAPAGLAGTCISYNAGAAAVTIADDNKQNFIFGTTALAGDQVDIVCDGVSWICRGVSTVNGAITFT